MKKAVACLCITSLFGCASSSKDITGAYVSPMTYQQYDCAQLLAETARVQTKVNELGGRLDEAATHDKQIAGVGIILFWPALFALGGTKQQEAEYASLKGQADAIQQAGIAKKCALPPVSPPGAKPADAVPQQVTDSGGAKTTTAKGATTAATADNSVTK